MASTEVMRAGVRVAVAFLLSEISTSLEKGEEKRDLFAQGTGLGKGINSVHLVCLNYEAVGLIRYRIP
jgi:hypothetical protein